jgi:hypothetical protein
MVQKVFVLVKDDEIKCYHDLRQLTESNKLPYYAIYRTLAKGKTHKRDNILIGQDTISYKRKPREFKKDAF